MRSLKKGDADIASWKDLDVQSPLCGHVLRWPHFAVKDHFPRIDGHWWITNLPDSLNSFFMTRNRSQRSRLRHKHNNVLKHFAGTIRVRCFRSVAELELAIRDIEEIASKSKRRLFGLGFFDTPQSREQMLAAAQKDWLRIFILYLGGKPAAFWKGTLYGGCLRGDHVGYDQAWSKFSPGIFLFLNMIEDLRKEGVNTVDLGFGDTQLKQYLGNLRCLESQVRIYAPTLRGILLNLLNLSCPRINDCARFLLQRTSWLEWARRTKRKRLELQNSGRIAQASGQVPAPVVRGESPDSSK
jgi:CelD/BcsL family acetyltransferase involved in cellulose biosynthesis